MSAYCAILLAAGRSRRFGTNKLLYRLNNGLPLAVATVRPLIQVIDSVVAVVSPGANRLERLLRDEGVRIAVCQQADRGMGRSLATGIAAASEAAGWIVALADMPYIRPNTISQVFEYIQRGSVLVTPVYAGHRGHPVGFGQKFRDDLRRLDGDLGARGIIHRYANQLTTIAVDDPGILRDIDVPADIVRNKVSKSNTISGVVHRACRKG